eukprot:60336-Amphidinium_carterae.1
MQIKTNAPTGRVVFRNHCERPFVLRVDDIKHPQGSIIDYVMETLFFVDAFSKDNHYSTTNISKTKRRMLSLVESGTSRRPVRQGEQLQWYNTPQYRLSQ